MSRFQTRSIMASIVVLSLLFSEAAFGQERITFGFKGTPEEYRVFLDIIARFNRDHDDVQVEVVNLMTSGSSPFERLAVLHASNRAPDVVRLEYQRAYPFIKQGMFFPIDDLIAGDPEFDPGEFFTVSFEPHRADGKLYAIPQEAQPFTLFVNVTALERAGLALPGMDWTMDDLLSIAQRTKRTGSQGETEHWGWLVEPTLTRAVPYVYAFGGGILNADGTDFALTSPETLAGLQFIQDANVVSGVLGGNFARGTTTLYLGGPWQVPGLRESIHGQFEWDILPVPGGPGGRGTTLGSDGYYMSSQTKNREAAWKFLKYLASEESQRALVAAGSIFPARREVAREYVFSAPSEPPYNLEAYLVGLEFARPSPAMTAWFDVAAIVEPMWRRIFNGEIDPKTGMEEILPQVRALLGE